MLEGKEPTILEGECNPSDDDCEQYLVERKNSLEGREEKKGRYRGKRYKTQTVGERRQRLMIWGSDIFNE